MFVTSNSSSANLAGALICLLDDVLFLPTTVVVVVVVLFFFIFERALLSFRGENSLASARAMRERVKVLLHSC